MLFLLYLCTGFIFATVVISCTNAIAYTWHGVRQRLENGESANLKGAALREMFTGWVVLALSSAALILISSLYS